MGENSDTNTQKLNTWMPVGRGSTDIVTAPKGDPQQQQRVTPPQKPATISFPQKKSNKISRPPRPTNRPTNRPVNRPVTRPVNKPPRPHKPCKPQPPSLKPQVPVNGLQKPLLTKPKPLKAGHPVHVTPGASVARQTPQIPAPKPVQHAQEEETEDASTSFASHFDPKSLCSSCF
jgi:hypothetical protein